MNELVAAIDGVFDSAEDEGTMNDIDWTALRKALALGRKHI